VGGRTAAGEAARMADKDVKIRINTEANTAGAQQAEQSLEKVGSAVKRADTGQANLSKSTNTSAGSFTEFGRHVQNTSYQVQDFVVQVQGGTDAARAFAQQAPQLFAGFGPGGAVLGLLLAFAPAIASMFGKVRDELRETAKAEEEHKAEVEDLAKAYDFLAKSFDVLVNNSAKRVANLEKEQQLAERAEKAETERAKRQAQNDGGKEIAEERIRLATVEAQLSTSSGEAAVRLAKEREEILKRIAAKEKEIAETLRKKDEESAEKRVTDAQKVVDTAKQDSQYADRNLLDEARARDENARRLQEEKDARARLIAELEAEIEEAKKARTNRGLAQQRVQDGKLGLDDLEKKLQEAQKPTDRQTELEAKAKKFEENADKAGDAAQKLADHLKEAYDKLQQATIDRDQLKQNNVQARGKEIDDQEVEAKRKSETGTQKVADDLSQKVEGMIEQITAAIPDAKSNPAVQALVERLRQIEQGGTQEGELNEAEALLQQLAGKSQGADTEKRALLTQIGTTFDGVRSLFSDIKTAFQQQGGQIDEMRRDLNSLKQQMGNQNY